MGSPIPITSHCAALTKPLSRKPALERLTSVVNRRGLMRRPQRALPEIRASWTCGSHSPGPELLRGPNIATAPEFKQII